MTPLSLGIFSSAVFDPGDFESIATVTVGSGGAANVEFTSIPSTYAHLQVRAILKSTDSGGGSAATDITINNNTPARYHYLYGDGSQVLSGGTTGGGVNNTVKSGVSNTFSVMILDILDYANTNKNKTVRSLGGYDANGSGELALHSVLYSTNTNAITSIKFALTAGNYAQYSHFALYGIRSA